MSTPRPWTDPAWRPWHGPTVTCPKCGPSTAVICYERKVPMCPPCGFGLSLPAAVVVEVKRADVAWDAFNDTGQSEVEYMTDWRCNADRKADDIEASADEQSRQRRLFA